MTYDLKFTVCPKCGSHNWISTSYGAECLSCDWKYHGDIYQKKKAEKESITDVERAAAMSILTGDKTAADLVKPKEKRR